MSRACRTPLRSALLCLVLAVTAALAPVAPRPAQALPPTAIEAVPLPPAQDDPAFAAAGWATAPPVEAAPFAMVGLDLDGEVDVQIRTALGEGPWTPWVDVPHQHDEGPDPGSPEAAGARPGHRTHPVFTGEATRLQVRTAGGPGLAAPRAWLIDPLGLRRTVWQRTGDALAAAWRGTPAAPPASAAAAAAMPPIVSRAAWGADESIVRGPAAYARDVDRAFVHHTVGSNSYTPAQAAGVVRGVQAFHVTGNGWSDIGYNVLVDRFGTIYEGRAGGLDRAVIGAQAGGFNTRSTGVALLGTFTDTAPPQAALDAVVAVIAWKADIHHVLPTGSSVATSAGSSRYPEGTDVLLANVSGHRDVSLTACPGDGTHPLLPAIRAAVRERAGDLIVDHAADVLATRVVRGDPDADALTVTAGLDPPGPWAIEVRGPDGGLLHADEGEGAVARTTMPFDPTTRWPLGTYRYTITAPGRTAATDTVELTPPTIDDLRTGTALATADADGVLTPGVAVAADLWPGATWALRVTDPDGQVVHTDGGQGERLEAGWLDGVTRPGTYRLTVSAEDAEPASLDLEVRYDLLDRVGAADDAVGGAVLLSGAAFAPGTAERAVLARHDVFADALAGGPLGGRDGPLLLTPGDALDPRVAAELDRVLAPGATVYVLGGEQAVGADVEQDLRTRYGHVVRLAGLSRTATAVAVAEAVVDRSGATTAMIARAGGGGPDPDAGAPWADALAGGAYGAATGIPVLLSGTDRLPADTAEAIADLGIRRTVLLGGTLALSADVEAALPDPTRVAGEDRTATAAAVADVLWGGTGGPPGEAVVLANGYDADAWAWALAAAPVAARRRAPLLLTTPGQLAEPTGRWLDAAGAAGVTGGLVVGSDRLVPAEVAYAASDRLR